MGNNKQSSPMGLMSRKVVEMRIKKVANGFIVNSGYNSPEMIANTFEEVVELINGELNVPKE